MIVTEHNHSRSKIRAFALDVNQSESGLPAWATVYIHRGRDYCVQYSNVSHASMQRVQRAQGAMLHAGGSK